MNIPHCSLGATGDQNNSYMNKLLIWQWETVDNEQKNGLFFFFERELWII